MRNFRMGDNVAVFILFFGIALLEAIRSRDWLSAALFLGLAVVCLRADGLKSRADEHHSSS
jgi:hypothetical protein